MLIQPAASNDSAPPAKASPAAPLKPDPAAEAAVASRRRIGAALFASAAALLILIAFAFAHLYPLLAPAVAATVVVISSAALWGAARVDRNLLRDDLTRLADENRRLAASLESLSDTAWELRESEERYRSMIDAQGDLVVRRDASGKVTFVNPAFAKAFDRPAPAFLGEMLAVAPPLSPVAADGGAVSARDVKLVTASGPRWYSWVDIRMRDAVYSVARDITARKEVEQPRARRSRACSRPSATSSARR